jgi:hypothetical protein
MKNDRSEMTVVADADDMKALGRKALGRRDPVRKETGML